ncbi:MAG: PAS domain S-box protein [Verrucomicrobia bacterium]|nr:PAS domain S-box protein [Verrucomicrobiota bacterium]
MQTEDQQNDFINFGKLLPDLFAVFELRELRVVYVNPAGLSRLNPGIKAGVEKQTLTDFIGITVIDRFQREIYPKLRVLGSWAGSLSLQDSLGSEFQSHVKMIEVAGSDKNQPLLYLHASLPRTTTEPNTDTVITNEDMIYSLLEATPNSVYFKDTASRYLRISQAMATKLAIANPREAIGKTDFDYFTVDHATPAFEDEQNIIKTGQPVIDFEEKETFEDGSVSWVSTSKFPFYNRAGKLIGTFGVSRDITAHKIAEERLRMLSRAVKQCPVSIVITDIHGKIEYVNPYFEKVTGYTASEAIGQNPRVLKSGLQSPEFYQVLWKTISAGLEWSGELQNRRKNGELYWERASISCLLDESEQVSHYIAVKEDITARKQEEEKRIDMETRLQLSSKLESVGSLAAGVAHEINTPTQFVSDNVRFLSDAFKQVFNVVGAYKKHAAEHPECIQRLKDVTDAEVENEIDYLATEIPRCLEQSLDGLRRIGKIVGSLKEFSHPGGDDKNHANLNRAIETTVAVSRHEWKYVADVETELDPNLPQVNCVLDEINQALLNLVVNAAHAIEDAIKKSDVKRGTITIRTRQEGENAIIEVQDTGGGIPVHVRERIFEPFFTTKAIGKGTGQGLAIVQAVIVKKHRGKISFTTELGKGTTFTISLPITSGLTVPPFASA